MRAAALILGLALSVLLSSQPCAGDTAAPSSAPAVVDSLPVRFQLEKTTLTSEALRLALEQELRVRVSSVDLLENTGLSVHVQGRRGRVSFTTDKGDTITRTVELSGDDARSSEIVALLAGNLARDQASELLSRLAPIEPEKTEEAAPPAAEPEPPPPPKKTEEARKPPAPPMVEAMPRQIINLSLFHPMALYADSERRLFKFEFGAAYSRVGAIEGFGLTLGYLRIHEQLKGAAMSLGLTRVDGNVEGAQLSALVSEGHGTLRGYEGATVLAMRWGNVEGAQTAALMSAARDVEGFQGAAAVTLARDVEGVQSSVIAVGRDYEGAQLGIVSVARDVNGLQLGVVNVAKSVDVQIGIVNIVERVDGAAFGLVTVAGNGRVQPAVWGTFDSDPALNAGLRFVAGYAFSQLGGGIYETASDARSEAGGGFHLPWGDASDVGFLSDGFVEIGVHVSSRYAPNATEQHRLHYRAGLGWRLLGPLSVVTAVEVNHEVTDFGADVKAPRPVLGATLF